jgi:hypothetical protein
VPTQSAFFPKRICIWVKLVMFAKRVAESEQNKTGSILGCPQSSDIKM